MEWANNFRAKIIKFNAIFNTIKNRDLGNKPFNKNVI